MTTLIAFLGLIGAVLSLDAIVEFHCDDSAVLSVSQDGGSTIASTRTHNGWNYPARQRGVGVTCNTVVTVACEDTGSAANGVHTGGFIADVIYDGQHYYTTLFMANSNWEVSTSSTSRLEYTQLTGFPWRISANHFPGDAYWVWNGQTMNTMTFVFDFGNILGMCYTHFRMNIPVPFLFQNRLRWRWYMQR